MLRKILNKVEKRLNEKLDEIEYVKIHRVLEGNIAIDGLSIIDVGSGLCDGALFFRKLYPSAMITCVDINQDLVNLALDKGFVASQASITAIPYADEAFNIVHCSHVIEHLGYPSVTQALDELLRITKKGGVVIIRSPLIINHRFFNDIDHVRPYPPNAILSYFSYKKQQKISTYNVAEISRWYTRIYCEINYYKYPGSLVKYLNLILRILWTVLGVPSASPNNYGIALRKL
jgi:ubiquinone/menaquinone biosynthesis C-methylase UbiE